MTTLGFCLRQARYRSARCGCGWRRRQAACGRWFALLAQVEVLAQGLGKRSIAAQ